MKRIGIAVTDPNDWTAVSLSHAVRRCNMQPVNFSFEIAASDISSGTILAENIDLTSLDAVLVRDLGPATRNDAAFRFDILVQLQELGVEVINSPESIMRAANKHISSFLFQRNGIPTPQTMVTNHLDEALAALSSFGRAVIKPLFGYKGIDVKMVKNDGDGMQEVEQVLKKNGVVYLQEFIPHPGRDIRAFVVNSEVVGSIYRIASNGGWIHNLSQGGVSEPCTLTEEQKRLSVKAARVVGTVFAGVDIIEGERPYLLEINATPSGKGIFDASGVDVTQKIAEYVSRLFTE